MLYFPLSSLPSSFFLSSSPSTFPLVFLPSFLHPLSPISPPSPSPPPFPPTSYQLEATVAEVSQELRLVDEDMELVLLLQNGQVKMDLDALTKSLQPDFQGTRLLQGSELTRLNAMAEVSQCGESSRVMVGGGGGGGGR